MACLTICSCMRRRPAWWGHIPWEDVVVGALLMGHVEVTDHPGFKHPFMACDNSTVVSAGTRIASRVRQADR